MYGEIFLIGVLAALSPRPDFVVVMKNIWNRVSDNSRGLAYLAYASRVGVSACF